MLLSKNSPIFHVYVYLVSFAGLLMIVIPTVNLLQLAMRTWIFPFADEQEYSSPYSRAPKFPIPAEEFDRIEASKGKEATAKALTADEIAKARDALAHYDAWNEEERIFQKRVRRQRDLVRDIAFIIVGIPLFFLHWRLARRLQREVSA